MSIRETGAALRSGGTTAVAQVESSLHRVEENSGLNAFITVMGRAALERARLLDQELRNGHDRGPLHGIPVAVKDNLWTRGVRTTGGSLIFGDFVPQENAASVERLEAAGAVIIGKTNMHELAYGITSSNPHYGAVLNPCDRTRIPGGSSGGSGAAVAAGIVPAALGSDTGGSIRIPASYCGCVGFKPTYGAVDKRGCQPLGLTLDHVGPLAATVEDAALVFEAIAAKAVRIPQAPVRFGVPATYYFEQCDPQVAAAVNGALAAAAIETRPVNLPDVDELNAVARVILLSEASSVFERYCDRRSEFGADVLALLDQGRLVRATEYVNAQRARRTFLSRWLAVFEGIDCLVTPTTPNTAPPIGATEVEIRGEPSDVRLAATRFVRGINALGFPAISIPCGRATSGLPAGLQLIARPGADAVVLAAALRIERAMATRVRTTPAKRPSPSRALGPV